MLQEAAARNESENVIYSLKALDFHLPKIIMISGGVPAAARAEAPPLRKEWVLTLGTPGKLQWSKSTILCLVRNIPFWNVNKGPGIDPRALMKACNALTGQSLWSIIAILIVTPNLNGSVLL